MWYINVSVTLTSTKYFYCHINLQISLWFGISRVYFLCHISLPHIVISKYHSLGYNLPWLVDVYSIPVKKPISISVTKQVKSLECIWKTKFVKKIF